MHRERTFAVVLAGFCAFLDLYATQPLLPMLARVFGAKEVEVSLTVTVATLGVALAAPLAGAVSDRFGRRRTILASALALGAATLGAASAPGLRSLLVWRFVEGIFTPGIFAVTVALVHDHWPPAEAGRGTAAYVTGTVLGGFTGRFISGLAATHFDWRSVFLILGVLNLAGAAAMARWLPNDAARHASRGSGGARAMLEHFANPRLRVIFITGFCVLFSMQAAFTYITFHLADPPFRLRPASLGSLFFVYLIGAAITPAAGPWITRHGNRAALTGSMLAGIAGMLLTLIPSLPVVIAGLALCCTGVFIAQAAASAFIGTATARHLALAVGMYVTFYYFGGSAGAALPGLLWRSLGWAGCVSLIVAVQAATIVLARKIAR